MPWHAFTMDGLPEDLGATEPGTVLDVNAAMVDRVMTTVTPHIQKSVVAGISEIFQKHHKHAIYGAAIAGALSLATVALLWAQLQQARACCSVAPAQMKGCC